MRTYLQIVLEKKFLISSLIIVAFGVLLANYISERAAIFFGNWAYVPIIVPFAILSLAIAVRGKSIGQHGKAWILFACFAVCFSLAQAVWIVDEEIYKISPYPSEADIFWMIGYLFYFAFMIFYLKPFRKKISKKLVVCSSLVSLSILVPSLYVTFGPEMNYNDTGDVIAVIYPILDSLDLVPAIIGVVLFFRGEVNLLWTLLCLGIISVIIGDMGFLFFTLDETYYTGHPVEIGLLWSYIFFAFGTYYHYKLFKIPRFL